MPPRPWWSALAGLPFLLSALMPAPVSASAPPPVQVVLDGRTLTLDPAPTILDGRTLVPLRGVFEAMGASLAWNGETRTVEARRGDRYVRLRIDRRLACLDDSCHSASVLDVPAQLIGSRTFVPIRFISQALGASVSWDGARRAVMIDSSTPPAVEPAPVRITSVARGQIISDPVTLTSEAPQSAQIQYYLVNPNTGVAHMAAAGADPSGAYTLTPDPADVGIRLLLAAVRDGQGSWRYSTPFPILMMPFPTVQVTGAAAGATITGPVTFGSEVNFVATQVTFRLTDPVTGSVEELGTAGPGEPLTWYPAVAHNGEKHLQLVAADRTGKEYSSSAIRLKVESGYRQFLSGASPGATISRAITLRAPANYKPESVQFLLDDKHLAWGESFSWEFGPEANGPHTLKVRLLGPDGTWRSPDPVSFTVNTRAQVWLSGVGPGEVVTGPVTLKSVANVPVTSVEYHLVDSQGQNVELLGRVPAGGSVKWTPDSRHAGERRIRAIGLDRSGLPVVGDPVSFRVYLGKVYGPQPVVAKSEFLEMASLLSIKHYRETGMSAALKTAQAILETGWGQSGLVDKYSGKVAYNLFGIKGEGPAGRVLSNTWEEYNGVAYRVDAYFRAYHSIEESWKDHADLLLGKPWYAPYRAVMSSPVQGAWALRKSGYATDSGYPVKLINLMKQYDLFKLDEFEL